MIFHLRIFFKALSPPASITFTALFCAFVMWVSFSSSSSSFSRFFFYNKKFCNKRDNFVVCMKTVYVSICRLFCTALQVTSTFAFFWLYYFSVRFFAFRFYYIFPVFFFYFEHIFRAYWSMLLSGVWHKNHLTAIVIINVVLFAHRMPVVDHYHVLLFASFIVLRLIHVNM